jgi:DNA uptake protein ComE-like DNA-binding protein
MVYTNDAAIEEDDMAVISKYLAHSFGPSTPKLELPIHINTAAKEILALLSSLSQADVQKILDARMKEKFRDFTALEAIVGNEKLAKYRSVISFN